MTFHWNEILKHRQWASLAVAALALALHADTALARTQPPPLPATQASIAVGFTPGQALPLVLEIIRSARSTIFVAAYSFTSKPIAAALRDASRRGVDVFVLADAAEASKGYSAIRFLANERVPVRVNARYAIQHNKFMVIDGSTVQTGSFNYTASAAERNAENVLVLRNVPALAAQYSAEWRRLWDEGNDLGPAY